MSGLIPRSFIDDLIARIDLVEIIDSRVTLKKTGSNYAACCPFHNEKTPSFTVSPTKQLYHCFGCGESGNVISFLMAYERIDFVGAIEILAAHAGLAIPRETTPSSPIAAQQQDLYQLLEQVAQFYQEQLRQSAVAIDYLKQRNMTGQTAKQFGIGYIAAGWNALANRFNNEPQRMEQLAIAGMLIKKADGSYYDRFRERIMFPIRDRRGRIIGFGGRIINEGTPKYLNSPETPIFHKGHELYGLYEAIQASRELPRILVVEGYMDVVMLAQHQISYAVATLGTATTVEHIKRLNKLTKEIIFCFDGDKAGQAAAWKALESVLPVIQDEVQIRFLLLPEGEDPDSLVRQEGSEKFSQRVVSALTLSDFLFSQLMAKVNISTLDGKAKFANLIGGYLEKLPEGTYRQILFERLAQIVRIDPSKYTAKQMHKVTLDIKGNRIYPDTLMRRAIALLVQYPKLLSISLETRHAISMLELPGSQLLNELMMLIQQTPQITTAALLEHWRDKADYTFLKQLALREFLAPEEGIIQEFEDTLQRIISSNKDYLIEQLMLKARRQQLAADEKVLLQKLIADNKSH